MYTVYSTEKISRDFTKLQFQMIPTGQNVNPWPGTLRLASTQTKGAIPQTEEASQVLLKCLMSIALLETPAIDGLVQLCRSLCTAVYHAAHCNQKGPN